MGAWNLAMQAASWKASPFSSCRRHKVWLLWWALEFWACCTGGLTDGYKVVGIHALDIGSLLLNPGLDQAGAVGLVAARLIDQVPAHDGGIVLVRLHSTRSSAEQNAGLKARQSV